MSDHEVLQHANGFKVYVARNLTSAINPETGNVEWRYVVATSDKSPEDARTQAGLEPTRVPESQGIPGHATEPARVLVDPRQADQASDGEQSARTDGTEAI